MEASSRPTPSWGPWPWRVWFFYYDRLSRRSILVPRHFDSCNSFLLHWDLLLYIGILILYFTLGFLMPLWSMNHISTSNHWKNYLCPLEKLHYCISNNWIWNFGWTGWMGYHLNQNKLHNILWAVLVFKNLNPVLKNNRNLHIKDPIALDPGFCWWGESRGKWKKNSPF